MMLIDFIEELDLFWDAEGGFHIQNIQLKDLLDQLTDSGNLIIPTEGNSYL